MGNASSHNSQTDSPCEEEIEDATNDFISGIEAILLTIKNEKWPLPH